MKDLIKMFQEKKREKNNKQKSNEISFAYLEDIKDVRERLENVRSRYALALDEDLVESLIYEERSLLSRYEYLLKQSKSLGIKAIQ